MRVLVPPRDGVVARGGIRIRRDCGATHRPSLPTKSDQKMSAAGPGQMGEVGRSKLGRCCCGWVALPVPVFMDLIISVGCASPDLRADFVEGAGVGGLRVVGGFDP